MTQRPPWRWNSLFRTMLAMLTAGFLTATSAAEEGEDVDFELQIRPLFRKHCLSCHGMDQQKGGLRLDAKSTAFRGGDGGPVIVPENPTDSELIRRISSQNPDQKMPPQGAVLSELEIHLLTVWIRQGAKWEETDADRMAAQDPRRSHWAWQPLSKQDPAVSETGFSNSSSVPDEIDRFISSKLAEHGLVFSQEADPQTLFRRLSFDLIGLPPTYEQIEEFINNKDPQAYEKAVDSFLASPHYGERWARHWLDIAHYADTHGFERDQRRDHAWRYRDWVIRAFNSDLPYDQFLKDQIAGDVLRPDDPDAVAATGFLAAGPWDFVGQAETPSPVLRRLARADDLDDMVTQVMTAACGVTINCARCHDHKLDPISQREYFSLIAVFSGVKRGDRVLSLSAEQQTKERKRLLENQVAKARTELAALRNEGWSLSDIVGGGDGRGTGKVGHGIDPKTGKAISEKRGFLENLSANSFTASSLRFVDGVVIPDGGNAGNVVISSSGVLARNIPATSGQAWDAIRNGPVNSQFSTKLGAIDFAGEGHSILSLHANAAITFDLRRMQAEGLPSQVTLRGHVGYFGQTARFGADVYVLLDGRTAFEKRGLGRDDGIHKVEIPIERDVKFLTLMVTDHGNGISHDQICFADLQLEPADRQLDAAQVQRRQELANQIQNLQQQIDAIPDVQRVYSVVTETPVATHVHRRGNPEDPGEEAFPGAIACIPELPGEFGDGSLTDAQRRISLANWIASPKNPLTSRVIVNRLWHHHFGRGLVDTPGDFGLGGSLPTHPELLDWLAASLIQNQWSLKQLHRRICLSHTYRQSSRLSSETNERSTTMLDSGNRYLWRQNARRLDAESIRDAVLSVSGKLNSQMFGPGFRDFEYREEYAPVYSYVTADRPELWRRSIYRFTVRTTPEPFLTTLDCPNPANLTPARNVTTTAIQALALLNNDFMLRQSKYLAERVVADSGPDTEARIRRAFQLVYARSPVAAELQAAEELLRQRDVVELCRALLNSNEFLYVD